MDSGKNWWTRPCGGVEVLRMAIPLIISAGSISLMNFTDRLFLNAVSTEAMTASFQAGMFFWTIVSLPVAIAAYTNSFVAQYYGSNNHHRIGPVVWQGVGFGLITMPFLVALEPYCGEVFAFFKHEPSLIPLEQSYLRIVIYGSGATIASEAAASFFYGRGKMHVVMVVNIFCVFLNVLLDYLWIFGYGGFPAWGLEGAAAATAVSQWCRLLLFIGLMYMTDREDRQYCIWSGMNPDFPLFGRLIYYGIGSGVHISTDTACFAVFVMLLGGLSENARDATTIAFTLNNFTFMPLVGTGIAVSTLVGNKLGYNKPELAERATITAVILGSSYTSLFGLVFIFCPDLMLFAFKTGEFDRIHDLTVHLLQFVAVYLLFDGFSIIFSSAIKGAGDTWFVLWTTLVLAPFAPLFSYVGIAWFGLGVYWCWLVLTLWVIVSGVIFLLRFRGGKWQQMRVIEKDLLSTEKM